MGADKAEDVLQVADDYGRASEVHDYTKSG
jgi:hypothetical protein